MSQLGFCRIKVNTPSPWTCAHALEKRVPFPLCWGSQLLFPLCPKFPRFQLALAGFSASPDFNISPKKTKKQNAFSSKQLKRYVPISWAVIIHFTGVLLKKEKKKGSENSFCTRNIISLFPASVLLMHIQPFPSPPNPPEATHPKEPVRISHYASLEMCPRCLGKSSQLQQPAVTKPHYGRAGSGHQADSLCSTQLRAWG